jgi:GAF domain-containing protein
MEKVDRVYYESLFEIAASVNSSDNPDEVLRRIVETVAKALQAKGCALLLVTPNKKQLQHAVDCGLSESYIRKGPVLVDGRFQEVLAGEPVAILDVAKDGRLQYPQQAKQEGIASILSVPMKLKGEVIGVVNIYGGKRRQFSQEDIYFASGVAHLGAIALDNARRYDRAQKDYETCTRDMLYWGSRFGP